MSEERIKLRSDGPSETAEEYWARKRREDEAPPVTPVEDDEVEFVQSKVPGRYALAAGPKPDNLDED